MYTVPNFGKASLHYIIWAIPSKTANTIMKRHNETEWRNLHHLFDCNSLLKIIKACRYNIWRE
jgi:hypothetical protein